MFNLLVEYNKTAWETDQLMRMRIDRFKSYSDGVEAAGISLGESKTLKSLEEVPALLMYEGTTEGSEAVVVRYGFLRGISVSGGQVVFRFEEEGRLPRSVIYEYAERLGMHPWERNETHWAIKDGSIPRAVLDRLSPTYDVVLSFAGEDRTYVERVAKYLRARGVRVFYDGYEEANLWGKDLAEHFDQIYGLSGRYCVPFISRHYVDKMWTRHERRSALARALKERSEYILPARFDDTAVPGIPHTTGHIYLAGKSSAEFAKVILAKLGKEVPGQRKPRRS